MPAGLFDLKCDCQVHVEVELVIGSASLMLVSSSKPHASFHVSKDEHALSTFRTHTPGADAGTGGGAGDQALAVSMVLSRLSERPGASGTSRSRQGGKGGRRTDSVAVRFVQRRHGLDLSACFAALAVHAGEVAKVKNGQAQTEVLCTAPAAISRLLLQGLDPPFAEAESIKGLLTELPTENLLDVHVSTFDPGHVPGGRAEKGVELKVGALALHLDAVMGDLLLRRALEVHRILAALSCASPTKTPLAVPSVNAAPNHTPPTRSPLTLENLPFTPGGDGGGSRQEGGVGGMAAMLEQVQVHVAVGLVTAALGAHSSICAQHPAGTLAFRDSVRATCGGVKVLCNPVGLSCPTPRCFLSRMSTSCCHVSAMCLACVLQPFRPCACVSVCLCVRVPVCL